MPDEIVYMDAPPMPQNYGMSPTMRDNSTIAGMRWNGDQLTLQLYKLLGGYDVKILDDGTYRFERINGAIPKINDDGIQALMSIIQSSINPFVSLSNINDDEANELIRQILIDCACDLVLYKDEWEVKDTNLNTIMSILKNIIFNQQKRAVNGWEGSNFRTQTFEQNVQQQYTQNQNNGGGFSFWKPSSWKGGR